MFDHIVPCGIIDRGVTSVRAEGLDTSMADVREALVTRAVAAFGDGGVDRQSVEITGVTTNSESTERPLIRRLRQAGVEPNTGLQIQQRKPEWLRVPVRLGKEYSSLGKTIHDLGLVTVCEEAGCPNIFECWSEGTATFMINGERCTRACVFLSGRHSTPIAPGSRRARPRGPGRGSHGTCPCRGDLRRPR